jgi:hypothetical protein
MKSSHGMRIAIFASAVVAVLLGVWLAKQHTKIEKFQNEDNYNYLNMIPGYEYVASDSLENVNFKGIDVNEIPEEELNPEVPFADTSILRSTVQLPPEPNMQNSANKRPCAVYYVPPKNVELCNDKKSHWYTRPIEEIAALQRDAQATGNTALLDATTRVLEDRTSGKLPMDVCKVEFKDMVEPSTEEDLKTPTPYKTVENNRGNVKDWAYCFAPGTTQSDAQTKARNFGDSRGADYVSMGDLVPAPFVGDSMKYDRVAFNTFDFNTMTTKPIIRPDGLPKHVIVVKPESKSDKRMKENLQCFEFDNASSTYIPYADCNTVIRRMFAIAVSGMSLVVVPRRYSGSIHYLQFDNNGRLVNRYPNTQRITFNMANFGAKASHVLHNSMSVMDDTYDKTIVDMATLRDELQRRLDGIQIEPQLTRPNYVRGLVLTFYKMNSTVRNPPDMNSAKALDAMFYGFPSSGIGSKMDLVTTSYVSTPEVTYKDGPKEALIGHIAEGFLRLADHMAEGNYEFLIDADDGADLYINGQEASTHYGYHWFDGRGIKRTVYLKKNTYYPFRARYLQWHGHAGMKVFWRPPGKSALEDMPSSVFYYDENQKPENRQKLAQKQQEINSLGIRKANLTNLIDKLEKDFHQYVEQQLVTKGRTANIDTTYMSNNGAIYIDIGVFDSSLVGELELENSTNAINILKQEMNISPTHLRTRSMVRSFDEVIYSVCFWVRVDTSWFGGWWFPLLFHGAHDDWGRKHGGDRTPGVWLFPDNTTRVHVRHRSSVAANDGVDSRGLLPRRKWVPIVIRMNGTGRTIEGLQPHTLQLFIDGKEDNVRTLPANHTFNWGELANKKLTLNHYNADWGANFGGYGNVLMNHVEWYNTVVPLRTVRNFGRYSDMYPRSIQEVLDRASTNGVYEVILSGQKINVHVEKHDNIWWACILCYYHKGGTNPNLRVVQNDQDWPLVGANYSLGTDGSSTAPSHDGVTYASNAGWGHVGPGVLRNVPIREMLWFAQANNGKTINFRTSDPSVINYSKTGQGRISNPFNYTKRSGHNASIPDNAPHRFENQGDFAMTSFPFWSSGRAHWGIRGYGERWEVDDYPNNFKNNTIHAVWIR